MELLNFIFSDFWHFIGTIVLLFVGGGVAANILRNFRLFEINNQSKFPQIPQQGVNQNVFNDLVKLWNNRGKGDTDKK